MKRSTVSAWERYYHQIEVDNNTREEDIRTGKLFGLDCMICAKKLRKMPNLFGAWVPDEGKNKP